MFGVRTKSGSFPMLKCSASPQAPYTHVVVSHNMFDYAGMLTFLEARKLVGTAGTPLGALKKKRVGSILNCISFPETPVTLQLLWPD